MSPALTEDPPVVGRPTSPQGEEAGPWYAHWNWGLVLALTVMIAPTLFSRESVLSPNWFRTDFAKTVEGLALGGLVLWLIWQRWIPRFNLPMVVSLMFVAWSVLSGFWVVHEGGYHSQIKKLLHSYATTLALFLTIRTRRDLEHTMLIWKATSLAYALLMVGETLTPMMRARSHAPLMVGDIEAYRAQGPSGHADWAGFFLGATMVMQPYFWFRYTTLWPRVLLALTTLTEMFALIAAHVRLGLVGCAIGGGWLVLRGAFGSRWKPIVAGVLSCVALWPFLPESFKTRTADSEFLSEDHSIQTRMALEYEGLRLGSQAGLLGAGYGGFGYKMLTEGQGFATEDNLDRLNKPAILEKKDDWIGTLGVHNAYLEVLIETGMIGLSLFAAVGFMVFVGCWTCSLQNRKDVGAWQLGLSLEAMTLSLAVMLVLLHAQERRVLFTLVAVGSAYIGLTRNDLMRGQPGAELGIPWDALRFLVPFLIGLACLGASLSLFRG